MDIFLSILIFIVGVFLGSFFVALFTVAKDKEYIANSTPIENETNRNIFTLCRLVKQYPALPVFFRVVAGDKRRIYYTKTIRDVYIGRYVYTEKLADYHFYCKLPEMAQIIMEKVLTDDECKNFKVEHNKGDYEKLPWKYAIIVEIES